IPVPPAALETAAILAHGRMTLKANQDGNNNSYTGILNDAESVAGSSGHVMIQANIIEIYDGGLIRSETIGSGNAGNITVSDASRLIIDGSHYPAIFTGIAANTYNKSMGAGDAGMVTIHADVLELRGGGEISSGTFGKGNAGEVTVNARQLTIDGPNSPSFAGIGSQANAGSTGGRAGAVTVTAGLLELRGGGTIATSTFGPGDAGEVTVDARQLIIDGDGSDFTTGITSDVGTSGGFIGTGDAGTVSVTAQDLMVRGEHGTIRSGAFGRGDAGRVMVTAGRIITVDGGKVETDSDTSGAAGNVDVHAPRVVVRDGGLIGSSGTGTGPAGDVQLTADILEVADASIRTVGASSQGGAIAVSASELIELRDAEVTASGAVPETGRSVITLRAPLIAVNDSEVTALTGTGVPLTTSGLVELFGGTTVISSNSSVAASSGVTVTGLENEVGSQLVVPQGVFLNADNLLRASCAARRTATASSFTAMGRGGLPSDPAGSVSGSYTDPDRAAATDQARPVLAASFGEGCKTDPDG
ncbi:hypothetical protein, partial [Benzoatithermus flavus]